MDRIDTVTNAMELRGFGKKNRRTWYMGRPLKKADVITILVTLFAATVALIITYHDGNRFYNPFV